jgi:hypothetical protein
MLIRTADKNDLDGLTLTHVAAWHEAYADILSLDVLASVTIDRRRTGWVESLADPNRQNLVCVSEMPAFDRPQREIDTLRIPRHPSQEIRTGTLNAILSQPGLKRK